jgi:hypothetical protein
LNVETPGSGDRVQDLRPVLPDLVPDRPDRILFYPLTLVSSAASCMLICGQTFSHVIPLMPCFFNFVPRVACQSSQYPIQADVVSFDLPNNTTGRSPDPPKQLIRIIPHRSLMVAAFSKLRQARLKDLAAAQVRRRALGATDTLP